MTKKTVVNDVLSRITLRYSLDFLLFCNYNIKRYFFPFEICLKYSLSYLRFSFQIRNTVIWSDRTTFETFDKWLPMYCRQNSGGSYPKMDNSLWGEDWVESIMSLTRQVGVVIYWLVSIAYLLLTRVFSAAASAARFTSLSVIYTLTALCILICFLFSFLWSTISFLSGRFKSSSGSGGSSWWRCRSVFGATQVPGNA